MATEKPVIIYDAHGRPINQPPKSVKLVGVPDPTVKIEVVRGYLGQALAKVARAAGQ